MTAAPPIDQPWSTTRFESETGFSSRTALPDVAHLAVAEGDPISLRPTVASRVEHQDVDPCILVDGGGLEHVAARPVRTPTVNEHGARDEPAPSSNPLRLSRR